MAKEIGKILIVDDDETILLVSKYILDKHFEEVITLNDPGLINEVLDNTKIDVALLDMNYTVGKTTGQEGFDLLRFFKENVPETRIVMMTAFSDIDIAITTIKEGASDFIVKPWDNAKFVNTVLSVYKKGPSKSGSIKLSNSAQQVIKNKEMSEVERIFMFLDLSSSTEIAEKLGHIKYFELLNDFFNDIDEPILKNNGEIYQYVGDEVVVSWPLEDGTKSANCLKCFFDIKNAINDLSERYFERYGLIPSFKAGMHFGIVSTGTIGTQKKEVIYTGDVLNTTSRIEGQCNHHNVNLLLSKDLLNKIPDKNEFVFDKIGEINLRGKTSHITLFTSRRN